MTEKIDPMVAAVISHLTPPARKRLDAMIRLRKADPNDRTTFLAGPAEMPGLHDVNAIRAEYRRSSLQVTIHFEGAARWEREAMHVVANLPETALAAVRGRPLSMMVDHPLMEGAVVSSARTDGDWIIFETRVRPRIDLSDVESTGETPRIDVIEEMRRLGVDFVCIMAERMIERLDDDALTTAMLRLRCEGAIASITDLVRWMPANVESMGLHIGNGTLWGRAGFGTGRLLHGRLQLSGSNRSNAKILQDGMFTRFRAMRGGVREPKAKTMTLDQFEQLLQYRKRPLAKAA